MILINQIIISGIIVLLTGIYVHLFLRVGKGRSIMQDLNKWVGAKENFIRFKEFEYGQTFQLVFCMLTIAIPAAAAILNYKELVSVLGWIPYSIIGICLTFTVLKFLYMVSLSSKRAIENMKKLLSY